jgi:lytic murein transglycosylase
LSQYRPILNTVSEQYGVPPEVIVAVWGVESNFGKNFGKFPLVQSLGTLSCYGRRQDYFKTEFFSALRIVQSGDIKYEELKGSWAGAFGHTQFMPSTFEKTAVDFDGDGKRDLINNIPDALASTANFLKKAGWIINKNWGYEVKLPNNFDNSNESRKTKRDVSYWNKKGRSLIDGSQLPNDLPETGLLTVSGVNGPVFLVTKNFDAIYKYNAAESYALAIAHLSDRIKGGKPFMTSWPTDDGPLNRVEKLELQNILIQKGYQLGDVNGEIGPKTKAAIKSEQIKLGLEPNSRAGQKILLLLRQKN